MKKLSRSELHKLVWRKPMIHLAKEFGLSDVALAKICRKHRIPRPIRGYWARRAAGKSAKKIPLRPAGDNVVICFDKELNERRRKMIKEKIVATKEAVAKIESTLSPEPHNLGERVAKAFESAKPGDDGRVEIKRHTTPSISTSPKCADRIVKFISALAHAIEEMGAKIVSGKDENESVRFVKNGDIIHLDIEEKTEMYELEPTPEQKRQPSWTWNNKRTRPTGVLVFMLHSPNNTRGRRKWTESGSSQGSDLLPKVIAGINDLFEFWKAEREESARRKAYWEEQKRINEEKERRERHEKEIKKAANKRRTMLFRASEWFRLRRDLLEFIDACQFHWSKNGEVTDAHKNWLTWARGVAESLNPLEMGYPDPDVDGGFDKESIPFGGPYPETQKMPLPHSVREIERLLEDLKPYGYRGY